MQDLKLFVPSESQAINYVFPQNLQEGQYPAVDTMGLGVHSETTAGVTLDSSNVPSTNSRRYHTRVQSGPEYQQPCRARTNRARQAVQDPIPCDFHQQTNQNCPFWLRARSVKYA